jgi:hypothetical protein
LPASRRGLRTLWKPRFCFLSRHSRQCPIDLIWA